MSSSYNDASAEQQKNIVIIGGSYAAVAACFRARTILPEGYRIIIIEKHTHLHFMFAFPRAIVMTGFEHELFVPYKNLFASKSKGLVVNALATEISSTHVTLDRSVDATDLLGYEGETNQIPYDYLIYAAGASHPEPTSLSEIDGKAEAISRLRWYQDKIRTATKILVCGGGAAGIETACEIKETYPDKEVILVHSRERYMHLYRPALHQKAYDILKGYGVTQILGERVKIPEGGFDHSGKMITVSTTSGREIECDLQLLCTGLTPNSQVLETLSPKSVNTQKYVSVKPTMQIADERYPNVFAAGDVTDTEDVKTAHSAWFHGWTSMNNIVNLIKHQGASTPKLESRPRNVPQIILYLGLHQGAAQMALFGWTFTLGTWWIQRFFTKNVGAERAWVWLNTPIAEAESS
ncbi:hypothetical protein HDU96_008783 [Phlyctochytrium bullatum]|nr:hypothetical protein HDU96_008783 [Phlyctochytrium bullatum]